MSSPLEFDEEAVRGLREMYAAPEMARRRRVVRESLDLNRGERVLDIGVGPGYEPAELLKSVTPTGTVVGVDASSRMLEATRDYCTDQSALWLVRGGAASLPFDNDTMDAAVSVQVYEYVPDLRRAFEELYRVLRPGGRAAVFGTDWGTFIWRSVNPDRMQRVIDAYEDHCLHTDFGRRAGAELEAVGFELDDHQTVTLSERELSDDGFSGYHLEFVRDYVADHDAIGEEEADAWVEEVRRTAEKGEYFYSLTQVLAVARKPA